MDAFTKAEIENRTRATEVLNHLINNHPRFNG